MASSPEITTRPGSLRAWAGDRRAYRGRSQRRHRTISLTEAAARKQLGAAVDIRPARVREQLLEWVVVEENGVGAFGAGTRSRLAALAARVGLLPDADRQRVAVLQVFRHEGDEAVAVHPLPDVRIMRQTVAGIVALVRAFKIRRDLVRLLHGGRAHLRTGVRGHAARWTAASRHAHDAYEEYPQPHLILQTQPPGAPSAQVYLASMDGTPVFAARLARQC
jgi:hypothetical protein